MSGMNRSEQLQYVAFLDALAEEARARSAVVREQLQAQAVDEFKRSGVANSGQVPGLGSVSLPLTKPRFVVDSDAALAAYVAEHHEEQIEQRVRPAFGRVLLAGLRLVDGAPTDGAGRPVPGVRYEEGGQPLSLRLRPDKEAEANLQLLARGALDRLFEVEPAGEVAGDEAE